jgi:hypothetical protein
VKFEKPIDPELLAIIDDVTNAAMVRAEVLRSYRSIRPDAERAVSRVLDRHEREIGDRVTAAVTSTRVGDTWRDAYRRDVPLLQARLADARSAHRAEVTRGENESAELRSVVELALEVSRALLENISPCPDCGEDLPIGHPDDAGHLADCGLVALYNRARAALGKE